MRRSQSRPPLRFDWSQSTLAIDGEFRRVYRARLTDDAYAYAFRERGAWRWGIVWNGQTLIDGVRGTLIDAKHSAENAMIVPKSPEQMRLPE